MVNSAMVVGASGSKERASVVEMARGSVRGVEGSRQGVVPVRVLGERVSVMA